MSFWYVFAFFALIGASSGEVAWIHFWAAMILASISDGRKELKNAK